MRILKALLLIAIVGIVMSVYMASYNWELTSLRLMSMGFFLVGILCLGVRATKRRGE